MPTVADTMDRCHFRKRIVRLCHFSAALLATGSFALLAYAGLRGPGKYNGVMAVEYMKENPSQATRLLSM